MSVQDFIAKRQAALTDAFNQGSLDHLLEFYVDKDLDFSDCGNLTLHMDKSRLREFFVGMHKTCGDMKTTTVSVSGTQEFTAWEWNIEFNAVGLMPDHNDGKKTFAVSNADGRRVKMIGISATWWNAENKIVKNKDYGKVVPSFEGLDR
ncbi:MAG: hypothetical protein M1818_006724 [Claussenomyces sp. TS43310]|nr:MAG: hypothetical protein M1818_006724 [Claussenomyces sp. TS43310]